MGRRRNGGGRASRHAVLGSDLRPFSPKVCEVIAAWADGTTDVSDPALWAQAPEALQAILADRNGWEAVRGPGELTWHEANLSLQVAAEQQAGFRMRERARVLKAQEDAAYGALKGALG